MKIVQENGLPEFKYHILPRIKCFTLSFQGAENRIYVTNGTSNNIQQIQ
ncbi:unnamed protein product, partial [Rotaria sordida]